MVLKTIDSKGSGGSNPSLSAINKTAPSRGFFIYGGEGGPGSNPRFDKFAGSKFARPKGARRARRREAPSNPCSNLAIYPITHTPRSGAFFMDGGESGFDSNPLFDKFARSKFEHLRYLQMARRANYMDVIRNLTGVPVRCETKPCCIRQSTYLKNRLVPRAGIEPARCCHRGIFIPTTAFAAASDLKRICGLDFTFTLSWHTAKI